MGHHRRQVCWPWNVVWLVFMSWVFHMLMSGRIIPTVGKPPTPWSFDSALEFWMSFSLQIENKGLVEIDLSVILDPFDFNQFMLCPCAISFFQKFCPALFPPVSCSFPESHPDSQCCLYNLLRVQPENSWPLGGDTV